MRAHRAITMRTLVIALFLLGACCDAVPQRQFSRFSPDGARARGDRQLDFGDGGDSSFARTSNSADSVSSAVGYSAPSVQDNQLLPGYGDDTLPGYSDGDKQAEESRLSEVRSGGGNTIDMLLNTVPGNPGQDYPIYGSAPRTSFTCNDKALGGYYADPEAQCQSFHICGADLEGAMVSYTFLCPNGTIFNQEYFICDWWFNVECDLSADLAVSRNEELLFAREEATRRLESERILQAQGSARVDTVVRRTQEPVSGYRASEAAVEVIVEEEPVPAPSEPVASSYRASEALDEVRVSPSSRVVTRQEFAAAAPSTSYRATDASSNVVRTSPTNNVFLVREPATSYRTVFGRADV